MWTADVRAVKLEEMKRMLTSQRRVERRWIMLWTPAEEKERERERERERLGIYAHVVERERETQRLGIYAHVVEFHQ